MKIKKIYIDNFYGSPDHIITFKFNNQWNRSVAIRPNTTAYELGKMMIELGNKIIEDQEGLILKNPNGESN